MNKILCFVVISLFNLSQAGERQDMLIELKGVADNIGISISEKNCYYFGKTSSVLLCTYNVKMQDSYIIEKMKLMGWKLSSKKTITRWFFFEVGQELSFDKAADQITFEQYSGNEDNVIELQIPLRY